MKLIIMANTVEYILGVHPEYFGEIHVNHKHTSSGIDYFVVAEDYFDDGVTNPY